MRIGLETWFPKPNPMLERHLSVSSWHIVTLTLFSELQVQLFWFSFQQTGFFLMKIPSQEVLAPPATTAFRPEPSDRRRKMLRSIWGPWGELLRRSCPRVVSPSSGRTLLCRGWGAQKACEDSTGCSMLGWWSFRNFGSWDMEHCKQRLAVPFLSIFLFEGCSRDASHGARPSTGVPSCLHLICCLTARLGEQSSRVPIHRIEAQQVFKSLSILLPLLVLLLQLFAGLH